MKSPSDDGAAAVCCMCGDHGLPEELFRCKFCRVRLQHRYCSDLYPRVTAYRRCNWCLREEGDVGAPAKLTSEKRVKMSQVPSSSEGCSRRTAFAAVPSRPVKKLKADTRTPAPPPPAKGKTRFRAKVQRYKLLEEVISC